MQSAQDIVLIRPAKGEQILASGIVIPESKEKPEQGEVVAVGPGVHRKKAFVPTQVKPGQKVLFHRLMGQEIKFDGEIMLAMREPDVVGIIE